MPERPIADRRPFGPLLDLGIDESSEGKIQLGTPGTVMPGKSKGDLNILFVLDSHVATLPNDVDGSLELKIRDKLDLDLNKSRVTDKRSGTTSSAPFDEQAVIVMMDGDDMPVQDTQLHMAANSIERHYNDLGVGVKQIIMDTE